MATTYKNFLDDDISTVKSLLNENIPIPKTIISSSIYGNSNIKTYSHGMFESVYDYPWTSASANQLMDMTFGISDDSAGYNLSDSFVNKKVNIYNQMCQVLNGYDQSGNILKFDIDGDPVTDTENDKYYNAFFLNFNRLLVKDEIKKGTFEIVIGINSGSVFPYNDTISIKDIKSNGNIQLRDGSPTGEFGILYVNSSSLGDSSPMVQQGTLNSTPVGLIFYQAGVAVLSTGIFAASSSFSPKTNLSSSTQGILKVNSNNLPSFSGQDINTLIRSGSISEINGALRNRISEIKFNNTTELNSTIYFCRINQNDFNYSSNPTYLSEGRIVVKAGVKNAPPTTFITTVGLYSQDNELLAVAKLSEPIKKDPTTIMTLRVRTDY